MFDENQNDDNQIVDNSLNRETINKWDHEKNSDFQINLNGNELRKLVNDLETVNLNNLSQEKINSFVYELGNVVIFCKEYIRNSYCQAKKKTDIFKGA